MFDLLIEGSLSNGLNLTNLLLEIMSEMRGYQQKSWFASQPKMKKLSKSIGLSITEHRFFLEEEEGVRVWNRVAIISPHSDH